jgi:2-polyprenyl-3-methyl-5-hydroxy-6-metoxy-1,4-benzoquinol methylase
MSTTTPVATDATVDEFTERFFTSVLSTFDILAVFIGDRLGWYRALTAGPATAEELVARAGGSRRYAQEWLEQQAATGYLAVTEDGRFRLPAGAAEVLTDADSLAYLAPLARMVGAAAVQLPGLVRAYREGGGVSWDEFGPDMREAQADVNRPIFLHQLGATLAGVPAVHEVLSRPQARIADVGCGAGWSSVALAAAYPDATVDGWDVDEPSIGLARDAATSKGVADRTTFTAGDAAGLPTGAYDAVFAFECVHDMPDPVAVLRGMRRAVKPDGVVVVMDEAVGESFTAPAGDVDRTMYGYSVLICLPDGLSTEGSVGTGTVMRPETLRRYARAAGFSDIEILETGEFGFFRFYRLLP